MRSIRRSAAIYTLVRVEGFSFRRDNEEGPNGYFEYPAAASGRELLHLDGAVWYVRRYCYYMRGHLPTKTGKIDRFPVEIARIRSQLGDQPHKVRVWNGYLERVLDRGPEELRDYLVWKNPYFGRRSKRVLRRYVFRSWSANPTSALQPEIYDELKDLVDFSPPVRDYLEHQRSQNPSGEHLQHSNGNTN